MTTSIDYFHNIFTISFKYVLFKYNLGFLTITKYIDIFKSTYGWIVSMYLPLSPWPLKRGAELGRHACLPVQFVFCSLRSWRSSDSGIDEALGAPTWQLV